MMAMKENSRLVLDYLKAHKDDDMTAKDVAAALNLADKQVNGIFTSALQKKGLGIRVPADGTHATVKFLKLTDAGLAFDPDADAE